jgi:hypothetical protein
VEAVVPVQPEAQMWATVVPVEPMTFSELRTIGRVAVVELEKIQLQVTEVLVEAVVVRMQLFPQEAVRELVE